MGTWSAEILDDDLAQDVQAELIEMLTSMKASTAYKRILKEYSDLDDDESAVLHLAVASTMMDENADCPEALQRALQIVESGAGLDRWREEGAEQLAERLSVYKIFCERLSTYKPSGEQKRRPRMKRLKIGDVVEIPLDNGKFAYARLVFRHERYDALIEIAKRIEVERQTIDEIDFGNLLFRPVFTPIDYAVRDGHWLLIGNIPVVGFEFPLFVMWNGGTTDDKSRWWTWDGVEEKQIGPRQPPEYIGFESRTLWGVGDVEDRLVTGVNPAGERGGPPH